jgi:hypothetical protein
VFICTLHLYIQVQCQNFYESFADRRSPLGHLGSEYKLRSSVTSVCVYHALRSDIREHFNLHTNVILIRLATYKPYVKLKRNFLRFPNVCSSHSQKTGLWCQI